MVFQETETIELKRILNDSVERAIVAFLNTQDGAIYIGVEDDGKVIGVDKIDETLKRIADVITTQILPNPQDLIELGTKFVDGKQVIEIKVAKGKALYYIKKYGRSANGCYIRIGTSNRSMTEEQIERNYAEYLAVPKPTLTNEIAPRQDLTFRVFKIYLDSKGINYNESNFYENYNFKTLDGRFNFLAYALSDQFDISIKVAKFAGNDKRSEFVYRKEFGGCCLIKTIDDVISYIESSVNVVRSYFDGKPQRRDEFLLDKDSVREAWINACVHNDYSTHLGPSIYLYADHLEVFSYGNALKNITKEKFLKGISSPINPELAKICMRLEYVEESGKGINTIVGKYGEEVFEFEDTYLQVNIPYNKKALPDEEVAGKIAGKVAGKTQDKILEILKDNPKATVAMMMAQLSMSDYGIRKNLKALKEKGLIERVGSDKTGYWKVL